MKFEPGEDVIVDFGGLDHRGEVISHQRGYVLVKILADPEADYGSITARLDPQPTVGVKESKVRRSCEDSCGR